MPIDKTCTYFVVGKKQETPTITTLVLTLDDSSVPTYVPGQCITVYFPDSSTQSGKTYSISSAPFESVMTISVRAVGEFSNRLCSMECGDSFLGSWPWGFFNAKETETDLFMIASGMGVAPFRGIIIEELRQRPARRMYLLYSTRTLQESLFCEEFAILQKTYAGLQIQTHITREPSIMVGNKYGRIQPEDIMQAVRNIRRSEFLICGSASFVSDQKNILKEVGVLGEHIHCEAHF